MDNQILTGKRVLVVEDEMLVLMAIEDMLADLGCTSVTVAGSVKAALDTVATDSFDLATLDVNLNGMDSYPIADSLTARGIPFAFSTGYGEHGVADRFSDRLILRKPYSFGQFKVAVTALLTGEEHKALRAT